jgi:MFS family permease
MFLFWVTLFLMPATLTFRIIDPASPLFLFFMFLHFFQFGSIYGPVFGTVQELVSPRIRGTVTAVTLLMINVLGLGLGVTLGGIFVDWLIANGYDNPYTISMVAFNLISFVTIPLFFFAGRRFAGDKQALLDSLAAKAA